MIKIGLTGGIGSGKSEVLRYLQESHGAYIMEADRTGHGLLANDEGVRIEISRSFGSAVFDKEGSIDREALAKLCFADSHKLDILNAIIHPAVKEAFFANVQKAGEKYDIFVLESAILTECGYVELLDCIWYVYCDERLRRARLQQNRGYTAAKAEGIIASQPTDRIYRSYADVIIDNSHDIEALHRSIDEEITKLKKSGS